MTAAQRYRHVESLRREFAAKSDAVFARLAEFRRVGQGSDETLFEELCFCLLAVQTRARASDAAVRGLASEGLLRSGGQRALARYLHRRVRFHNHKAAYIERARRRFFSEGAPTLRAALNRLSSAEETRAWLVREIDGLGLKEASHFLRNIGRGENLAILDRHVLRNLAWHRVIDRVPTALTPRRYEAIEGRMRTFADAVRVPVGALDLVFWSRETGEIFK